MNLRKDHFQEKPLKPKITPLGFLGFLVVSQSVNQCHPCSVSVKQLDDDDMMMMMMGYWEFRGLELWKSLVFYHFLLSKKDERWGLNYLTTLLRVPGTDLDQLNFYLIERPWWTPHALCTKALYWILALETSVNTICFVRPYVSVCFFPPFFFSFSFAGLFSKKRIRRRRRRRRYMPAWKDKKYEMYGQLLTVDLLAHASMKNAANCDT